MENGDPILIIPSRLEIFLSHNIEDSKNYMKLQYRLYSI